MGVEDPTVAESVSASLSSTTIADLEGRVLKNRYRMNRLVGSGSMGDVYEGIALGTGDRIAIKVLKPERAVRDVYRHRFLREAKSAVRVSHPNVVDVLDYGETSDGLLYIAMEFLEGEDLASYIKRTGALPWVHAVSVLQQVAAALAAAHDNGVVHRDVKPSNILLRPDGHGGSVVKLVDFGVAKLGNHLVSRVLTKAADVVGTVLYMSPEQAEGREADLRSDVYAFGVTAYQLTTGGVPFPGTDLFKVMSAHMTERPRPPHTLVESIPVAGSTFILRCLEKGPQERYQSMHDVLRVLAGDAPPDMLSQARANTPISSEAASKVALHPPLSPETGQIPLDPHAPTMGGGDFDDEAPTAYFRSAAKTPSTEETPAATAPRPPPAAATAPPTSTAPPPSGAHTQPAPASHPSLSMASSAELFAPAGEATANSQPEPFAADPWHPAQASDATLRTPPQLVSDEELAVDEPSRAGLYVAVAAGVLAVVVALWFVVGG